jgi:hypothetical protein
MNIGSSVGRNLQEMLHDHYHEKGDANYNQQFTLKEPKLKVSVNQTVRVKLTLKQQDGKKAPGVAAKLNIVSSTGNTIPDLLGETSPSGKVVWKFKIRDYDPAAVKGDTFTLTVSITDIDDGTSVDIGSTDVEVR